MKPRGAHWKTIARARWQAAVWSCRAQTARMLPMEVRSDLVGVLLVLLALAVVPCILAYARVPLPLISLIAIGAAGFGLTQVVRRNIVIPARQRADRTLGRWLHDPATRRTTERLGYLDGLLHAVGILSSWGLGLTGLLWFGFQSLVTVVGPLPAVRWIVVGAGSVWGLASLLAESVPTAVTSLDHRPWPRPSRAFRAAMATVLNAQGHAAFLALLIQARWSQRTQKQVDDLVKAAALNAVATADAARFQAAVPHLQRHSVPAVLEAFAKEDRGDFLEAVLPAFPSSWFQDEAPGILPIADAFVALAQADPVLAHRMEAHLGPAVWTTRNGRSPLWRAQWIGALVKSAARAGNTPLWTRWSHLQTDPLHQADQIQADCWPGVSPGSSADPSSPLALADLPRWMRAPECRLPLLIKLRATPHHAGLVGELEEELIQGAEDQRHAILAQAVPYLVSHPALATVMDHLVARMSVAEQQAWRAHESASAWERTRIAQRQAELAARPVTTGVGRNRVRV